MHEDADKLLLRMTSSALEPTRNGTDMTYFECTNFMGTTQLILSSGEISNFGLPAENSTWNPFAGEVHCTLLGHCV